MARSIYATVVWTLCASLWAHSYKARDEINGTIGDYHVIIQSMRGDVGIGLTAWQHTPIRWFVRSRNVEESLWPPVKGKPPLNWIGVRWLTGRGQLFVVVPHWFVFLVLYTPVWIQWAVRFSLRTLLIVTTLIAVTLGVILAQAREIPRNEIFASVQPKGMKRIGTGQKLGEPDEPWARSMDELRKVGGASNVFLVDATNIGEAVMATSRVMASGRPADQPAMWANTSSGKYWLVAYLGRGHSSPSKWIVDGVVINGKRIRFTYRKPKVTFQSTDIVHYYYWVPIDELKDGIYSLELYDADRRAVTLMRMVEVERQPAK